MKPPAPPRPTAPPLRLAAAFAVHSLREDLTHRGHVGASLLQSVLAIGTGLAILWSLLAQTGRIGSWSPAEALAVFGTFTLIQGLVATVLAPNLEALGQAVRNGELEHLLVQPVDFQLQISLRRIHVWGLIDAAFGLALVGWAAAAEGAGPTHLAAFAVALICAAAIAYAIWLVLAAATLRAVRADNFVAAFQAVLAAGRFPASAFPFAVKLVLTAVVPVAFITTVPAAVLVRPEDGPGLAAALGVAAAALVLSRLVLMRTLRGLLERGG